MCIRDSVCIVSAVMVSIGAAAEIILQVQGKGPGIAVIFLTMALAGGLAYICLLYTSYIIFSDKTLRQMSTYLPVTKEEMLSINGVGSSKYEKYGEAFSEEIQKFIEENRIEKE